ncbi:MAG: geranylgeranyl reductase family protein [Bifidobacteriaceae bacterium]|nr:geranylgeranyl reductase family protein [Bifidobacteriaceae bacterium]
MGRERGWDADVIVGGAGPAGSAAAAHLARAGVHVILLDKDRFPRDKVCGDGLTPNAVRELAELGVPIDSSWRRTKGLRVHGGGHVIELPWPDQGSYPDHGLVKPRDQFDAALLAHARSLGADAREGVQITGPITDHCGRVVGVAARGDAGEMTLRAPLVIAADGGAARLGLALGRTAKPNRPMGVAVRAYFRPAAAPNAAPPNAAADPNAQPAYMESHLELWDGPPGSGRLLPGYGWIFPLADGRLNVGLGTVSSAARAAPVNYKDMLKRWAPNAPGWKLGPGAQLGPARSAALPMAFNRGPLYADGLLLAGDAAGLVSPFNGEGIAQALVSGRLAAKACAGALRWPTAAGREQALAAYPRALRAAFGGYFTLGRLFVRLIEHPEVMRVCTRYGLPRSTLMKFTMKLLSGLYEPRGGDWMDRSIATLARMVPAG